MNLDYLKNILQGALLVWSFMGIVSCSSDTTSEKGVKPNILVSTLMIAEGVENIVGNQAEVNCLMGPGVDPHLFRPTAADLNKMRQADIIILNGLHLEGRLGEITQALQKEKTILFVSDYIDSSRILYEGATQASPDPHIWMDPSLWAQGMQGISEKISEYLKGDTTILARGKLYTDSLSSLHKRIQNGLNEIPTERRVLVTAHDAFQYFSRAYAWEVKGLQGISTASDIGIREVSEMVNFLAKRKIPAVFPESAVSERNLEAVIRACAAKGHTVAIGPVLFTDAPGSEGSPEGSYSGMLLSNMNALRSQLR